MSYYYPSQDRWNYVPAYYAPTAYYGPAYYAPTAYYGYPQYSAPYYAPSYYQEPYYEYQDADRHMIGPHVDYHAGKYHAGYAPIYE